MITVTLPNVSEGPLLGVDYMIELAGPNPVPPEAARALLTPAWQNPLGQPKVWGMGTVDTAWRAVSPNEAISLDSLALTWRILSDRGPLSQTSAETLRRHAESFAQQIGRRAFALPQPDAIAARSRELELIRENLDVGVNFDLVPLAGPFDGKQVLELAQREGLKLGEEGLIWEQQGWPTELAGIFAEGALPRGGPLHTLSFGFRVATSPQPTIILGELLSLATDWSQLIQGALFDDEGALLDIPRINGYLREAITALEANGVAHGSPASLALFSD